MKSILLVMFLLSLPLLGGFGQSVDQDVTVVGKDETIMTVPDPPAPEPEAVPSPDLWLPETRAFPVVLPPPAPDERQPAPEEATPAPEEATPAPAEATPAPVGAQPSSGNQQAPRDLPAQPSLRTQAEQPAQDPVPTQDPAG